MDGRCQQRSIAINDILYSPTPTGWRTCLARGCTWFSSICCWSPGGDRFHVSPVLLTREPTGTQAIEPGASRSTLTLVDTSRLFRSRGHFSDFPLSTLQGWLMVRLSMASGFPIPRGCCWVLSVARFTQCRSVRHPVMPRSPLPHHRAYKPRGQCWAPYPHTRAHSTWTAGPGSPQEEGSRRRESARPRTPFATGSPRTAGGEHLMPTRTYERRPAEPAYELPDQRPAATTARTTATGNSHPITCS